MRLHAQLADITTALQQSRIRLQQTMSAFPQYRPYPSTQRRPCAIRDTYLDDSTEAVICSPKSKPQSSFDKHSHWLIGAPSRTGQGPLRGGPNGRVSLHSRVLPCLDDCPKKKKRHWLVSDRETACVKARPSDAFWQVTVRFHSYVQPVEGHRAVTELARSSGSLCGKP